MLGLEIPRQRQSENPGWMWLLLGLGPLSKRYRGWGLSEAGCGLFERIWGVAIRLSADFSKETLQARRNWQEVFRVLKDKDLQPRLHFPAKLSFIIEGHIELPRLEKPKSPSSANHCYMKC